MGPGEHVLSFDLDGFHAARETNCVIGLWVDWREGDFVAWINTLVLHSATDPLDTVGPRLMHRVRLSTPKTRWVDGAYTSD